MEIEKKNEYELTVDEMPAAEAASFPALLTVSPSPHQKTRTHVPRMMLDVIIALLPAYVFGVTEIYRRLLDEGRAATPEENRRLADLFSRGGFTDAYFRGHAEEKMTGTRTREDKEASRTLPPDRFSTFCMMPYPCIGSVRDRRM